MALKGYLKYTLLKASEVHYRRLNKFINKPLTDKANKMSAKKFFHLDRRLLDL